MRSSAAIFLTLLASTALAQIPDFSKYPKPPPKHCDDDKGCSFACAEEGCLQVICDGLKCTRPNGWHFEWTQEKKNQFMKEGVCRVDPTADDEDFTKCFRRCNSTSDCLDEEYCNVSQNACQEKVADEEKCKADTDCESLSCVSGKCGSNVGKDCQEDEDCPAINGIQGSRLCSKTTKKCLEGNVATGKKCSEDAQCGSGCCKEGTCQYCKKCESDKQCPFSLSCLESSAAGETQKTCQVPPPPPPPECHLRIDCEGNLRCFKSPDSDLNCNPGDGSFDAPCKSHYHCQGRMKCFDGQCGFRGKNCGNTFDSCGNFWNKKCCDGLRCQSPTPGRVGGAFWCR